MILVRFKWHNQYRLNFKPKLWFSLQFLTHVEQVFWFSYNKRNDQCLPICTPTWFPSVSTFHLHLHPLHNLRTKSVSECFLPLSSPWRNVLVSAPHQLIIIHLGGRISAAWDIRPITQSQEATSPSPPTLPLLSRRAPIYWKGHCA